MSGEDVAEANGQGGQDAEHDRRGGEGVLIHARRRTILRGRALKLILWVARRQDFINDTAAAAGQLWMTWKGDGPGSIDGNIKVPL